MGKFSEIHQDGLALINDYLANSNIDETEKAVNVIAACLIEMNGYLEVITDILKKVEEESISNDKR